MGQFIGYLISIPFLCWLYGWVVSLLWGWFVVPFGAPAISIAWAVGLSCLVSMVSNDYAEDTGIIFSVVRAVLKSLLMLVMGYCAHYLMLRAGYTPTLSL